MRLGVFGGSFDPVHTGHLRMAEVAREAASLDRVLFVPTQVSPFKTGRTVIPSELRLEMLRLAVADNPAFGVSDAEVRRAGPSYTVDTLRELAREYPEAERFFLTGTDAVRDLTKWREPEEILRLARFLVMTRPGVAPDAVLAALPDTFEPRIAFISMPGLDISSSFIRDSLAAGRSVRYLLPPAVLKFIDDRALYRSRHSDPSTSADGPSA
ncbi:MAG: nicotinate-nucleotide adenylyltransferase [Capsulimonadales bacterium]|nr:nicotinate-nucleotide adenylyltransferase [Capsulimonadales bacterium]